MPAKARVSDPPPRTYAPAWLAPADVKSWLRLDGDDTTDDALIAQVCAAAEPYVQQCRPEWVSEDGAYTPDSETYQGAVMYAAREYRRKNSPAGVEVYGEGVSFVSRFDPDIDRALRTGPYAPPIIA